MMEGAPAFEYFVNQYGAFAVFRMGVGRSHLWEQGFDHKFRLLPLRFFRDLTAQRAAQALMAARLDGIYNALEHANAARVSVGLPMIELPVPRSER